MKKLTIVLASWLLGSGMVFAQNYEKDFYTLLNDSSNIAAADSLLKVWQKAAENDPELQIARFNSLLNKSRSSMIKIGGADEPVEGEHLVLTDSLGNEAGSISEMVVWNDSIFNECIDVIQHAIKRWPDRLDMRWGAAKALSLRKRWEEVAAVVNAVFDRSAENNNAWLWTYGEALGDETEEIVREGAFVFLTEMLDGAPSVNLEVGEALAGRMAAAYPYDCRMVNVLGAIRYNQDDKEGALNYFLKANEICPTDGVVGCNIARIYMEMGNKEKALEWYEKIKEDSSYDEEIRNYAERVISHLKEEYKPMRKYEYFFRYLSAIASQISVAEGKETFSNPKVVNTDMAAYNLIKTPFEDSEITVMETKIGGKDSFVWQFPEPEEITHCLYVAFVSNGETYNYYTLEKSLNGGWVIGGQKGANHYSFGSVDNRPATLEEFVEILAKKLSPE